MTVFGGNRDKAFDLRSCGRSRIARNRSSSIKKEAFHSRMSREQAFGGVPRKVPETCDPASDGMLNISPLTLRVLQCSAPFLVSRKLNGALQDEENASCSAC